MLNFLRALQRAQISICGPVFVLLMLVGGGAALAAQSGLKVVVSVKPLHSIVAGVMQGESVPVLLVSGTESPHGFALKPSQARALQDATLVFWVGPELEQFLEKSVGTLARKAEIVALGQTVPLMPYRKHGLWQKAGGHEAHGDHGHEKAHGDHGHKKAHEHAHHGHGARDPHFWLDPILVRKTVPVIARALSKVDPANAARYRMNAELLQKRLDRLHGDLETKFAPVRQVPYLVFHDAYQYLETRYRLASVGTITLDPERRPGARHLARIRREVEHNKAECLFKEPQFKPSIITVVQEAVAVRLGELDPLGVAQRPGPDAYFDTLKKLAENLTHCLGNGGRRAEGLRKIK